MRQEQKIAGRRRAQAAPLRTATVLFAAAAFLLQSLIVQTHIHGANFGNGNNVAQVLLKLVTGNEFALPGKKSIPERDDSAKCPFCQAVMHAGAFLSPAAAALAQPLECVSIIEIGFSALAAIEAVSHNWLGRAPPPNS
jgi:hypothetical protein